MSDTPKADAINGFLSAILKPYSEHITTATAMLLLTHNRKVEELERENTVLKTRAEQAEKESAGLKHHIAHVNATIAVAKLERDQTKQQLTKDRDTLQKKLGEWIERFLDARNALASVPLAALPHDSKCTGLQCICFHADIRHALSNTPPTGWINVRELEKTMEVLTKISSYGCPFVCSDPKSGIKQWCDPCLARKELTRLQSLTSTEGKDCPNSTRPFTCFRCADGNTPLYCLNCAETLLKENP